MHAEPVKIRCKASWDMKLMVSGISSRFWDDFFHIQACNRLDWCVVDIFSFIVLGANHDMCTDGGIQGRKSWFGQLFRLVGWEQRQMDVLLSIELRAAFLRVICLLNFRRCLSGGSYHERMEIKVLYRNIIVICMSGHCSSAQQASRFDFRHFFPEPHTICYGSQIPRFLLPA